MMKRAATVFVIVAMSLAGPALISPASARSGETVVTGTVTAVDQATRIVTIKPDNGDPVAVQFSWNVGGPCDACIGGGRTGALFENTITVGSVWTITYTSSVPAGTAAWFPGGTVHTVYNAHKPGESVAAPPRGGQREQEAAP